MGDGKEEAEIEKGREYDRPPGDHDGIPRAKTAPD
jgi:hypothetical protein